MMNRLGCYARTIAAPNSATLLSAARRKSVFVQKEGSGKALRPIGRMAALTASRCFYWEGKLRPPGCLAEKKRQAARGAA